MLSEDTKNLSWKYSLHPFYKPDYWTAVQSPIKNLHEQLSTNHCNLACKNVFIFNIPLFFVIYTSIIGKTFRADVAKQIIFWLKEIIWLSDDELLPSHMSTKKC